MEYSLNSLVENYHIRDLSLSSINNELNKIGLEVEKYTFSQKNFFLDLKIPADRQDLKNIEIFRNNLSSIFQLTKKNKWGKLKSSYASFFLKKDKLEEKNYTLKIIDCDKNFESPEWIKIFLRSANKEVKNNIEDLINFFQLFYKNIIFLDKKDDSYSIYFLENEEKLENNILDKYKRKILLTLEFLKKDSQSFQIIKKKNFFFINSRRILLKKQNLLNIVGKENYKEKILNTLGLKILAKSSQHFYFLIPKYREDLKREIDIIEEYCRFFAYEKMSIKKFPSNFLKNNKKKEKFEAIKNFFVVKNFDEVLTTSLNEEKKKENLNLINPLNIELLNLQSDLSLNHIRLIKKLEQLEKSKKIKIFEIARIFKKKNNKIQECDFLQASILLKKDGISNFLTVWHEAKEDFEHFFEYFNFKEIKAFLGEKKNSEKKIFYIKGKEILAEFKLEENPSSAKYCIFVFRLNLDLFLKILSYPKIKKVKQISKYPEIEQDLSFVCENKEINLHKIKKEILFISPILSKVHFFDLYIDVKNTTKISFGLRLTFQSYKKTLTKIEVEKEVTKIQKELQEKYTLKLK